MFEFFYTLKSRRWHCIIQQRASGIDTSDHNQTNERTGPMVNTAHKQFGYLGMFVQISFFHPTSMNTIISYHIIINQAVWSYPGSALLDPIPTDLVSGNAA